LGNGLYLRVKKTKKVYVIRKTINGKAQIITLGETPPLSLKDARLKAIQIQRADNISNITVSKLLKKYWNEIVEPSSKVPKQVEGYLNNIDVKFGSRKVIDITRSMLVAYIQCYSAERGARSADRIRSYLKQVFSYSVELGYLESSPMSEVTKRITGYTNIERIRVLSISEIKKVWNWENNKTGWQKTEDNARLIKFLLLTGLRISEAQKGYQDGEYFRMDDTKGKHSKTEKRPHWIYLTVTAKSLLPLPKCTATNIQAWLRRKLISDGYDSREDRYTPHDCRRSFTTIANDAGVLPHIVEKCINHKLERMQTVYNHAEYKDERIKAFKIVEQKILEMVEM